MLKSFCFIHLITWNILRYHLSNLSSNWCSKIKQPQHWSKFLVDYLKIKIMFLCTYIFDLERCVERRELIEKIMKVLSVKNKSFFMQLFSELDDFYHPCLQVWYKCIFCLVGLSYFQKTLSTKNLSLSGDFHSLARRILICLDFFFI